MHTPLSELAHSLLHRHTPAGSATGIAGGCGGDAGDNSGSGGWNVHRDDTTLAVT